MDPPSQLINTIDSTMGELLKESYDLRVDASNQRGLSLDAPPVSLALPVSPVSARNPSPSSNATTYNAGPAIPQIPETIRPAPALIQTANPPIPPIPPSPTALAPSAFPIPIDPRPSTTSKKLIKASDVEINYARPLGEGGFGMVYVGLLKNSVPVAVKELRRKGNEKEFQAFLKEVETWDGLAQNHILPLMAYCLDPPMLITDHMKQGNLLQYLRKHEWNFNVANKLLLDVTSGLTYLHANNVVHGDLKGANILISDDRAVIADFGMSRIRPPAPLGHSTMAPPTTIGGTTGFMAPEVLLGRSARPPADVFAFGMVCYEVYSEGQRPFKGVPDYRIKTWVEDGRRPVRPIKLEADCDDIWRLMEDCWKQDPKTRPEAAVVRNRLDEIIMSRELRLGRLGN